jgi:non-specific protein-tyrosine kinase
MSKLRKAMEKAKQARGLKSNDRLVDERVFRTPLSREQGTQEGVRQEVRPEYTRTKRAEIDRPALRRNRIVSLFHEEAMTDQLKILRTQVLNRVEELRGNSLLVTSANPGAGKTTTAINLAVSISYKVDRTVLLVDADIRKPTMHLYLGLNESMGLSDYLLGRAEIADLLINPGIEKLVFLPGGSPLTNSSELLASPRMEALAQEMKGRYRDRFIIFDSPSLLSCADPHVLSEYVDGILMVVEAEKTAAKDFQKALGLLEGKPVIGTVLNKAEE